MKRIEAPAASAVEETSSADAKPPTFAQRAAAIRATQVTDADVVWYGDLVFWAASETTLPLRRTAIEVAAELRDIQIYRRRPHDGPMPVAPTMRFPDPRPVAERRILSAGIDESAVLPSVIDKRPPLPALDWLAVLQDADDFERALAMPDYGNTFGILLVDAADRFGYRNAAMKEPNVEESTANPGKVGSRFQPSSPLPSDAQLYEEWKQTPKPRSKTLAEKYKVDRSTIDRHTQASRDAAKASRRDKERAEALRKSPFGPVSK